VPRLPLWQKPQRSLCIKITLIQLAVGRDCSSQLWNQKQFKMVFGEGQIFKGERARRNLRENSYAQDRGHSSCEDSLTVRGLGSRRTCNTVLARYLVCTARWPNLTGSKAGTGSLCLHD